MGQWLFTPNTNIMGDYGEKFTNDDKLNKKLAQKPKTSQTPNLFLDLI